jgi:hypothetical protein
MPTAPDEQLGAMPVSGMSSEIPDYQLGSMPGEVLGLESCGATSLPV